MNRRRIPGPMLLAVCLLIPCGAVQAADIYWNGTSIDWGATTSWSTDSAATTPNPGAIPGSGDVARFNISTVTTMEPAYLNGDRSVGGLVFDAATLFLGGGGNRTLTLGADGIQMNASAGNVTLGSSVSQNVNVTLGANQDWTNDSANTLRLVNGITMAGFTLAVDGSAGTTALAGVVSGSGAITKSNAGVLELSAGNTFTGTTTLNAGVLRATSNANALGTGAATLTLAGGTLQLANSGNLNFARNTTVSGNALIVSDRLAAGAGVTHTLGTLSIGAQTLSIGRGGLVNSGTAGVTFGATTLTGNATFSPGYGTLLTVGAVTNDAHTVTLQGGGNFAQTGVWGNGAGGLTIASSFRGIATLNQANTFSGGVTLNAGVGTVVANTSAGALGTGTVVLNGGTLDFNHSAALAFNNAVTLGGDATIVSEKNAASAGVNYTLGALTTSGARTLILKGGNISSGTGEVTFGATSLGGALTVETWNPRGFSVTTIAAVRLSLGNVTGNGHTLTKNSDGILQSNASSGTPFGDGNVVLNGGSLVIAPASAGTLTVSGVNALVGSTFSYRSGTLQLTKNGTSLDYTIGNAGAAADSVLVRSGRGTLVIGTTSLAAFGATGTERLLVNGQTAAGNKDGSSSGSGIYDAVVVAQEGSGNTGLGSFVVADTVANGGFRPATYTTISSGTTIAAGTIADVTGAASVNDTSNPYALRVGAFALTNSGTTTVNGGAASGTNSGIGGVIMNPTATAATITGGTLAFGSSEGAIYVGSGAGNSTIASAITGSGGVSVFGPGSLAMTGTNTFTGGLVVNGATVVVSNDNQLGAVPGSADSTNIQLFGGATLAINTNLTVNANRGIYLGPGMQTFFTNANTPQIAGVISGPGGLNVVDAGGGGGRQMFLLGANTYSGDTVLSNKQNADPGLKLSNALALQNSTLDYTDVNAISGRQLLKFSGLSSYTFGGLKGNHSLDLYYQNNASYYIAPGGALRIGNNNQDTIYTGIISTHNSTTTNVGVTKIGVGTLVLGGNNTYGGTTRVEDGTLVLSGATTGTGNTVVAGGTLLIANNYALQSSTFDTTSGGTLSFDTGILDPVFGGLTGASNFTLPAAIRSLTLNPPTGTTKSYGGLIGGGTNLALVKTGAGTLELSGANTFPGGTTLTAGTLRLAVDPVTAPTITSSAIGTGPISVTGGTLASVGSAPRTIPNVLNFGTDGTDRTLTLGTATDTGKLTFTGQVNVATRQNYGHVVALNSEMEFAGQVTGPNGRFYTTGTGYLVLSNTANDWLNLRNDNFSGIVSAGGGANVTGFIRSGGSNVLSDVGWIGAGGNGVFDLNDFSDTVGGVNWQVSTTAQIATVSTGSGVLTLAGNIVSDTNAFGGKVISGNLSLGSATRTINAVPGTQFLIAANVTGDAGAGLTSSGSSAVVLSGTNSYTGATSVTAGSLTFARRVALYGGNAASWTTANIGVDASRTLGIGVGDSAAGYFGSTDIDTLLDGTHLGASTTSTGLKSNSILGFDTTNATGQSFTYPTALANPGTAATVGFAKLGPGTLTLSGNNTYTGTTTVSQGTLVLAGNNSSVSGATTVAAGAALRVAAANAIPAGTLTLNGLLELRADADTNFAKNLTAGGTPFIDVNRASGANVSKTLTLGTMSIGGQTLTVSGGNGYALAIGATTLTGAAVLDPMSAAITVASVTATNQNLTLSGTQTTNSVGAITTGSGTITKNRDSTWTLASGSTSTYSGATTINGGKLVVSGTKSGAGAVTVNLSGMLAGTGSMAGAVTLAGGAYGGRQPGGSINLVDGLVGTLTLPGSLTLSGTTSGGVNPLYFDLGVGSAGADRIAVTGTHAAANANGVRVYLNQLAGGAVDPGTYTLIQGGSAGNNFTGYTLGTTRAGGNFYSSLTSSGNNLVVTVAAGTAGPADAASYWKGTTAVWNTAQWYSDASATTTATGPGYQSNILFTSTTGPANLINSLGQDYETNSLTVDSGTAATTISGSNNMLTIAAGSANGNAAGSGIVVNNTAGTLITASRVGLGRSQTWTVGAGSTLTVQSEINDFGNGYTLTKEGAGTLRLNRSSTYSGGTIINAGTLQVSPDSADAGTIRGAVTINNGGTLQLAAVGGGSGSLGYGGPGFTVSVVNLNAGGVLDLTASSNATFAGITVNMAGGTWARSTGIGIYDLFTGSSYPSGAAAPINVAASATTSTISAPLGFRSYNTTFNVQAGTTPSGVDLLVSGHLLRDGGFGLIKEGPGTMALTFNNTQTVTYSVGARGGYDGQTTINAGTFQLGDGGTTGNLNPASPIVNNAALAFKRSNTLTQGTDFNSVIMGPGSIVQAGTGTTVLNSVNTYSGGTLVNSGTLQVASTGNINTTAGVTITGGDFNYNAAIDYTRPIAFSGTGGTVSGAGRLASPLVVSAGNTISPGNSPGILGTGDLTWATGGNYNWEMSDALAPAGTGFDQLAITGSLTIESGFDFNLWSVYEVSGSWFNGDATFDNTGDQYWVVATTTGGLFGVNNLATANIFTEARNGTGGFTNDLGTRSFSLRQGDGSWGTTNDVVLVFAVPEPGPLLLLGTGLAAVGWVARLLARSRRGRVR